MTPTDRQPLGLGIVGCGGAAAELVRAAAGSVFVRIVALHDVVAARAQELAGTSGSRIHASLSDLLEDPGVDAAYVSLPHDLLAATAVAALDAGRHVLIEKPLAIDAAGLRSIRVAAERAGLEVGVMFELRAVASVAAARELVAAGAIGDIRSVRIRTLIDKPATYWTAGPSGRGSDPWRARRQRAGGGVVLMNTIHQLDLVRWIAGLEVARVAAETAAGIAGVDVEDVAAATFRYTNGAIGSLVAAAHAPGAAGEETVEFDGTAGALRLGDPYGAAPDLRIHLRRAHGRHRAGRWIRIRPAAADAWAVTLDAFAAAIQAGRAPEPGLDDGAAALTTVLALYRAAASGHSVTVPPPGSSEPPIADDPAPDP
ncbi:MAG TPA: Gfo/Idh/MocA family oxidoreductase [Patescibacteria group bacterium]|nr:Gfo/Idh/MocA family oxidoreductase [Patescibacteria group bacterium]